HMAVLKGLADRAERKETVEALLHQVNLWSVRKKALAGFSGGMRQRFGIAQALIGNPRLLIVDEPTAGLDPEERNRFLNLLAGIGDTTVVILSTQIVDNVADLCPRMAVLSEGRILLEGAPKDLAAELRGHAHLGSARCEGRVRATAGRGSWRSAADQVLSPPPGRASRVPIAMMS
ncbi:MAG: ATP-binding cassette domain-containing protein, partial [Sphingomonas sp.]|nr:ATP-binding cassette domain-containing protein [Sphingomonas sp.]